MLENSVERYESAVQTQTFSKSREQSANKILSVLSFRWLYLYPMHITLSLLLILINLWRGGSVAIFEADMHFKAHSIFYFT